MKAFLSLLTAFAATALSALAGVDLGTASSGTPYDAYMTPVKKVLRSLNGSAPSMDEVTKLMRQGRGFAYSYTEPYVAATPEVTAAKRAGDCKAKALWLCDQLGDSNVRFVVGKARRSSRISHAWVMWRSSEGQWFVLDPTNNWSPIAAERISNNEYIPLFSWSRGSTYRHSETSAHLANIAAKRAKKIASR